VHRRRAKPQVTLPPPSTSLGRSEPGCGPTVKITDATLGR
jgi:hypothetical protein